MKSMLIFASMVALAIASPTRGIITPGPAGPIPMPEVPDYEPIVVGPAIVLEQPQAAPASPLVQIILNINTANAASPGDVIEVAPAPVPIPAPEPLPVLPAPVPVPAPEPLPVHPVPVPVPAPEPLPVQPVPVPAPAPAPVPVVPAPVPAPAPYPDPAVIGTPVLPSPVVVLPESLN
ncbi:alpha carbonic anhydrase 8-like [Trichoplusia ni]|uniref:Alpha carbonic anhydrase 8-like n=1 Tax=Trichoplusia ni TaxID=7111 RepID=A0A7E5WEN9_TRINI|nr:alpha carbonic anhydrase 8-like [Trichoplusia ni]